MRERSRISAQFLLHAPAVAAVLLLTGCPGIGPDVPSERTSRIEMESVIPIPEGSEQVRIWMPVPRDNAFQSIQDLQVEGPGVQRTLFEQREGNKIVVFSLGNPDPGEVTVKASFLLTRKERDAFSAAGEKGESERPNADPMKALQEDRYVPVTKKIHKMAARQTEGASTSLEKARRLYDWCVKTMKYDKEGKGWGRGDAVWACDAKRGNCTDFHSAFIAMARSQGIPARFIMGYPLPPDQEEGEVTGYHCWAEFYTVDQGWIPIDASEASLNPEHADYYFGRLTPHRFLVTSGRDLMLEPPQKGGPVNFLYQPVVEADGEPVEGVRTVVRFRPV
jgi:transglutaminase-like putative cysteine protease